MKKYVINGKFLAETVTGIQRYAYEITRELDPLVKKDELEIYVPENYKADLSIYKNIKVVMSENPAGMKWEQIEFGRYLKKNHADGINLCNVVPWIHPQGIACILDIMYKVVPQFYEDTWHLRLSRFWHCRNYSVITKKVKKIMTISEFSRNDIARVYHVDPARISVMYCGWQHFVRSLPDDSLMSHFPMLEKKKYFFSMCSFAKNKNLKWIIETARKNPDEVFALSGMLDQKRLGEAFDTTGIKNIYYLGRVSDEEAKALMINCKAFIFPTFYEGFGLPPLEAMSLGADCIVSNTSCLPEIYGDSVTYIDPYKYELQYHHVSDDKKQATLDRFSWKDSAKKLYDLIQQED